MIRRALRAALLAVATLAASGACGGQKPAESARASTAPAPRWEDAFDQGADIVAILRPQALRRDPIYGPLLRRVSLLAAARSAAVAATHALEAIESSEEVIIGLRRRSEDSVLGGERHGDVEIVMRGVSASIDPARVVDESGHTLWRFVKEHHVSGVTVAEYVHDAPPVRGEPAPSAALFVLPERVWYVATGEAKDRARDAFEHPFGRPAMARDEHALLTLRMAGDALVRAVPRLRSSGQLGSLGRHLRLVTFSLAPGPEGTATAELRYADEDAAAVAEVMMKRVVEVMRRNRAPLWSWLGGASVERADPQVVTLHATLPESLLRALAQAEGPSDDRGWPSPE